MKKIELFNRDGANLWLEKKAQIQPNIYVWELKVDPKHKYCLEYIRLIGDYPNNIEAVDPSGGPMINIGDEFEGNYKIVKIINATIFWLSERNNKD